MLVLPNLVVHVEGKIWNATAALAAEDSQLKFLSCSNFITLLFLQLAVAVVIELLLSGLRHR